MGVKLRFNQPDISFEIGSGILPILVFWTVSENYKANDSYIKLYMSPSVGGAISIAVSNFEKRNKFYFKIDAIYNFMIGPGFGGGIDYLARKGNKNIWLSGGVMFFPDTYNTLFQQLIKDEHLNNVTEDDISSMLINIRPYVGVTFEL
jgi:hypothetical protein